MDIVIEKGVKFSLNEEVTYEKTAAHYKSGLVEVYATPAMIAFMEQTCMKSVMEFLPDGFGTVGTKVNISHIKATPIKDVVTCETELIEVDRKRLVFKVTAKDTKGEIGSGIHERFIIDNKKFMSRL